MDINIQDQIQAKDKPNKSSLFEIISKKQAPATKVEFKEPETHFNLSLTTKNNSKSLLHLKQSKKPIKWSEQDSRTFFKCLEIFGMDFSMIKEVLSHKTQRQILRKFHKEKKRNPEAIEKALQMHESNLIGRDKACHNFLDQVFHHTSSDHISENFSDDSLDKAVSKKLKLMIEDSKDEKDPRDDKEENQIKPLDFYLQD